MAWTADNIPDLQGKTAVITGANSGVGLETARELASRGARVILAVRDPERGRQAVGHITTTNPDADLVIADLDLTSLASINAFASWAGRELDTVDLLINNAGVMTPPRAHTEDGFELQFGTNHLGHFALTGLLMEHLGESQSPRIVTVSSIMHRLGRLNLDDPHWHDRRYNALQAYADSKLANIAFTNELARRLADGHIVAVAAHPGWSRTNLQQHHLIARLLNPVMSQSAHHGALPILRAATGDVVPGQYYGPAGRAQLKGPPVLVGATRRSQDARLADRLWALSQEATGITFP